MPLGLKLALLKEQQHQLIKQPLQRKILLKEKRINGGNKNNRTMKKKEERRREKKKSEFVKVRQIGNSYNQPRSLSHMFLSSFACSLAIV